MADCGCAPKCACGADKRGEFFREEEEELFFSRRGEGSLSRTLDSLFLSLSPSLSRPLSLPH